ncbi:unnamed protein product, partial [Ectocarpus sp. 13 AM-2016]
VDKSEVFETPSFVARTTGYWMGAVRPGSGHVGQLQGPSRDAVTRNSFVRRCLHVGETGWLRCPYSATHRSITLYNARNNQRCSQLTIKKHERCVSVGRACARWPLDQG